MSETPRAPEEALDESELLNEFSSEERDLIQKIKERGYKDPKTFELLTAWAKKEEALAEKAGPGVPDFEFTLKRGKLFYLAGCIEEALENFQDAANLAYQLGEDTLEQRAISLFDKVKRGK